MIQLPLLLALLGCPKQAPEPMPAPAATTGPRKSPNDDREYRTLELDNGMKALLIRDEDTDMAAAALDIRVGQFHDPTDRQGLSHFLEHMLFMGTEKYPDVDEYRRFVTDHGGRTNAGTGQENTTYHFSIEHSHLEGALDRFAQFFIAPKLDPQYVDRERNAVHSEYSLKVKDEARRNREVMRATSNPEHPFRKFSVGNLDTLEDTPDNPLWDDLKAHYDSEYTASRMAVGVIGREDLDTLEQWVRDRFSEVPSNGKGPAPATVPVLLPEQLGVRVNVTPLADSKELWLQFPAPPDEEHFRKHPVGAITHLLGHEGPGSLFALLRSKGWIESLSTSRGGADDHTLIQLRMTLTDEGYEHIDAIAGYCFQQVRLVREQGLEDWHYQEQARIADLNFRFADESSPVSAARTCRNLQTYPAENVLDWWSVYDDFDPELVRSYLDAMRPENMKMVVIGPGLDTDQVEPLYQVPYGTRPIRPERIEQWNTSEIDPALKLPEPNPFIAEDVELADSAGDLGSPTKLIDERGLVLWHHQDISFGVPEAHLKVELLVPTDNLQDRLKNLMLGVLIDDSFEEFAYAPRLANLRFDAGSSARGLHLTVDGYDDKQPVVLEKLAERLASFTVDAERFELERDRVAREWRNTRTSRPMSQVRWEVGELLDPTDFDYQVGADLLDQLTVEQLQDWAGEALNGATVQMLVHGNTTAEEAEEMARAVAERFVGESLVDRPTVQVRRLPDGMEIVRDVEIEHDDSVWTATYQGADTEWSTHAHWQLLGQILSTPFFTELRTNQQLGYSVAAYYTATDRVPGLALAIQSSSAGPVELQRRVDTFLADYHESLQAMPDEEFETLKAGLIAKIMEAETRLSQRAGRYRWELMQGQTGFDTDQQRVAEIEKLDKTAMISFYETQLLRPDVTRLIVRSFGAAHGADEPHEPGCATSECVVQQMNGTFSRPY